ncbi:uncharacterized protein [Amphiura filiformis]|uniref:uncharacterized protein n=1 Tax=Amphiura filiformis TaxID=82378 RepID=UPI003B212973
MATTDDTVDVPSLEQLQTSLPVEARRAFRRGFYFKKVTSGLCRGYVQANIAGVQAQHADDFVEFCRANEGPLPLLHHSQPGDFSAGPLAEDSDIRTDVAAYNVLKYGEYVDIVPDLLPFGDVLDEYAVFYTGCSFSFDKILLNAGIHLEYADNPDITVSMYTTNIPCHRVGSVQGPMVVSMRPVPRHLVQVAVRATNPLPDVHGAPIHIGCFDALGIKDVYKTQYGDPPSPLKEDQIPVFWACGNTIKEVLQHTKHPLSFTMYSDCMYLSDNPSDSESSTVIIPDGEQPVVVDMVDDPYQASLVSEAVLQKLKQLQNVLRDGNVSVGTHEDNGFMKPILTLSHSSHIVMAVVLPQKKDNGYETNGFMGTVAMANMLKAVGKEVTLVVDTESYLVSTKIVKVLVQKGLLQESINVVQFPDTSNSSSSARDILTQSDGNTPRFDHLVMPIQTSDNDNSMCKQLFSAAKDLNVFTFQGSQQCSSDVYSYAVSIALYLLSTCPVHDRYRRRSVGFPPSERELQVFKAALPSIKTVASVVEILESHGFCCDTGTDSNRKNEDLRSAVERLCNVLL